MATREDTERVARGIIDAVAREFHGVTLHLDQDAYNEEDVYLVARMKGAGVIDRERPADQAF